MITEVLEEVQTPGGGPGVCRVGEFSRGHVGG